MQRSLSLTMAMVLAVVAAGCGTLVPGPTKDASTADALDRNGNAAVPTLDSSKDAVINGTTSPTLFTIPAGQQLAIGALLQDGQEFCTGTLIAPTVVLSAAHCTDVSGTITFGIGPDMANPRARIPVVSVMGNPSYGSGNDTSAKADVSLWFLAAPATNYESSIVPIPINSASISSLNGKKIQNVGYGITGGSNGDYNTRKYWVAEKIADLTSYDFYTYVSQNNGGGTCSGDSGGPSLYSFDGELRIVGTVSWGDAECQSEGHFARVDNNYSWIMQQINAESGSGSNSGGSSGSGSNGGSSGSTTDPCSGISYEGQCNGNVAVWCDNGQLAQHDCASDGKVCGYTGSQYGYYCMAAASGSTGGGSTADPCGGYTYAGTCEGSVAVWCENNQIKRYDCASAGKSCGYISSSEYYYCK
jgi:V8-like Glu-specific endopeptidase